MAAIAVDHMGDATTVTGVTLHAVDRLNVVRVILGHVTLYLTDGSSNNLKCELLSVN